MTDTRTGQIVAPWSAETVQALNAYQVAGVMHPFTCARDSQHGAGYLLATEQGWVCTEDGCDYTQDWAHDFMTAEAARTPFWQRAEVLAELAAVPSSASVAPPNEKGPERMLTTWHICPNGMRSTWNIDLSDTDPTAGTTCPCCGTSFVYTTDGWQAVSEEVPQ